MGNAVCTVNFPNSLTADEPSMTSGKVVSRNVPGMIRLEKREGTACGLEGRITFRKNVLTTQWSYKKTNSSERGLTFTAERSNTVDPIQEKVEVQTKVWIQYHFVILPKVKQRHDVNLSLNLQCRYSAPPPHCHVLRQPRRASCSLQAQPTPPSSQFQALSAPHSSQYPPLPRLNVDFAAQLLTGGEFVSFSLQVSLDFSGFA